MIRALLVVLTAGLVLACGPKSGKTPRVDLSTYPALQWAPADVSYAAVVTRVDAGVGATRELLEALGIVGDFELAEIDRGLQTYLGINPLSPEDLRAAGVDVAAGGLIYGTGFSPTLVFRLADPAAMQARIDAQRERAGRGAAIGVAMKDGVEVFTSLADRELHTHWAIDKGWMWVHFEIVDEHEPEGAWFEASRRAKGALAADEDFAWARARAVEVQPGASVIGLARPRRIAARAAALENDERAAQCAALVTPARAAFGMATAGGVAEGNVLVDTAGRGASVAALTLPVSSGWASARGQPALAAEWNLDADKLAAWFAPCDPGLHGFVRQAGVRGGRGFLQSFDAGQLSGRGAVAVDISHRKMIDSFLDIPGRSMFEKKKKFGRLDGYRLSPPMGLPSFDYAITQDAAYAAVGDGALEALAGSGTTPATVLAAVELRPRALSPEAWAFLLQYGAGINREGARERTVRRINRWRHATIVLSRDGDVLRLHARGQRN